MTSHHDSAILDAAQSHLDAAPFVRAVHRRLEGEVLYFDVELEDGSHSLRILGPSDPGVGSDVLVVAPRVTKAMAERIAEASASYVDRAGNMTLRLPPHFIHVEGKRPPTKPAGPMRAPGLRVLFAWLIEPALVGGTLHDSCDAAQVSVTAVRDMRKRLAELGYVRGSGKARAWTEHGRRRARQMWLEGYKIALRPQADLGGFQVGEAGASITKARAELESAWSDRHRESPETRWAWSGASAATRVPALRGHLEDRAAATTEPPLQRPRHPLAYRERRQITGSPRVAPRRRSPAHGVDRAHVRSRPSRPRGRGAPRGDAAPGGAVSNRVHRIPDPAFETLSHVAASWSDERFAVIGAIALLAHGLRLPRNTNDVDLVIAATVEDLRFFASEVMPAFG